MKLDKQIIDLKNKLKAIKKYLKMKAMKSSEI